MPLSNPHYQLKNVATGQYIPIEFVKVSSATKSINPHAAPLEGVFRAELPPMGYSTFLLEASLYSVGRVLQSIPVTAPEDIVVESRVYRVHFDFKTGAMKQITNKLSGLSGKFTCFLWSTRDIFQLFIVYRR